MQAELSTVASWRWHHLSARSYRVNRHWRIEQRQLEDVFLFIPRSGAATLHLSSGPQRLAAGHILILPERSPHAAQLAAGARHFDVLAVHGLLRQRDGREVKRVFQNLMLELPEPKAWTARLSDLCTTEQHDPTTARRIAEHLVPGLLIDLCRHGAQPAPSTEAPDPRLAPALAAIHANPAADLAITALAADCGLKPVRFRQVFQAATGRSPKAYQMAPRLREGARRLAASDDAIATIANAVGFADSRWFARRFQAHFGCRPSAYRHQIRDSALD
ncbi:MAG: AraC family transcriptional regulator [Planctomycetota bacterium]|jgi:AraC-like DNA-binding protein|nr:AraC family transcriptional regulator [Planctomycetota bacterium]